MLNRVSTMVSEQIKRLILDGTLKPGDRLPSERELSKMINVGRLSLREGLRILESIGILETKYGVNSGTYVSTIGVKGLTERFSDFLRFSDITIDYLTEARLEIGTIIIKRFVERATEDDIKRLEECIDEIQTLLDAGMRTREKSVHFHELIAQASKNPVFILIHNSLMDMMRQFLNEFDSPLEHSRKVLENNKRLLKYLKARDFEKASLAMKNHVTYVESRLSTYMQARSK
jgi:GntR family transcriptional regulator, transcriptional repressor for pyruvate dehydrogenase complex